MNTDDILLTTDDEHLTLRRRLYRQELVPRASEVAEDLLIDARAARDLARRYRTVPGCDLSRDAKAKRHEAQALYRHAYQLFRGLNLDPALCRRDRSGGLPSLRFERGLASMKEAA